MLTLCLVVKEFVYLGHCPVESHNGVAMISSIHDQILAHDSQTNEAEISTRFSVRSADIDAGKTRTKVSIARQQVYDTRRVLNKLEELHGRVWIGGR